MEAGKPPAGNGWYMPQLKIVLLGGRNSGKSSVGNLLLGKEEFVTKERTRCCRRVGVSGARCLTVVDTPGWWCDLTPRDTPELVKREIVASVTLCDPGPDAFVIVVKASSAFTEQRRRAVEEHVQLLGGAAWDHCLLALAFSDDRRLTEAEEHVRRAGGALRWLYDKCARRCHSLALNDDAQITQLMLKLQRMAAANGKAAFKVSEVKLQRVTEERARIRERAHSRFVKMKKQRAVQREKLRPLPEIRIVLLGAKASGKSSIFYTILGNNHGKTRTAQNHVGQAFVFGRRVTVVDTPGWWANYFSDETPIFDKREMVLSLSSCPPGPHAFLLIIRVDRLFTDTYRKAVEEHVELISDQIWNRVIVLFSFGDWLGSTTTEQYIESEGKPLQWVVDRCDNRYHILNNKTKGDGFQVRELIGKIEEMVSACGSNWYFQIESSVSRNLEQKMREETDRAEERRMVKERQRETAKANLDDFPPLSELKVALIGGRKSGKSSCGNTILARTALYFHEADGKRVTVLDTPGSLCVTYDLFKTASAFLLVVNVSSVFKEVHLKAIEDQIEEVGPQIWGKAMVLFSFGDCLGDTAIERRIESEGHSLRRLVSRCGNRYHVLDNKKACKRQVDELMASIEAMAAAGRLAMFRRGDSIAGKIREKERTLEAAFHTDSHVEATCEVNLSDDFAGSSCVSSTTITSTEASSQIVPQVRSSSSSSDVETLRDRCNFKSKPLPNDKRLSWTEAGQKLTINLPAWLFGEDAPTNTTRLQRETSSHSSIVFFLPHQHSSRGEVTNPVRSLCHPMLMDRTLKRLAENGSLQHIIDQWGHSSLQELEAFIDAYFEIVWEQAMGSSQEGSPETEEVEPEGGCIGVLANINQKLSKLDTLEGIKEDLVELKKTVEELRRKL
ncbi:GTPase IMAP family member 8 [Eucyclogobius newberryi]|uniref:GTPase IMAP family member 8 n=1 Tax=Eucyclogobius newberryi TaxID=166745 RepID=UPI003B5C60D0